jgi:hypothetical protein
MTPDWGSWGIFAPIAVSFCVGIVVLWKQHEKDTQQYINLLGDYNKRIVSLSEALGDLKSTVVLLQKIVELGDLSKRD